MNFMRCKAPGCRNRQSGLAVVEFVIVLLMLIPMMIGTVELGRYINQYNTLTKAVRDGARYAGDASLSTSSPRTMNLSDTIKTQTRNLVVYGDINGAGTVLLAGFDPSTVTVTAIEVAGLYNNAPSVSGDNHVSVSANYTFTPLFDFIPVANLTMTASTVQPAI